MLEELENEIKKKRELTRAQNLRRVYKEQLEEKSKQSQESSSSCDDSYDDETNASTNSSTQTSSSGEQISSTTEDDSWTENKLHRPKYAEKTCGRIEVNRQQSSKSCRSSYFH